MKIDNIKYIIDQMFHLGFTMEEVRFMLDYILSKKAVAETKETT